MVGDDRRATDHHPLVGLGALDPPADLDAREDGQVQVDQDQVERPGVGEPVDPLGAVAGLDDLVSLAAEELGDQVAEPVLVLDQKEVPGRFAAIVSS